MKLSSKPWRGIYGCSYFWWENFIAYWTFGAQFENLLYVRLVRNHPVIFHSNWATFEDKMVTPNESLWQIVVGKSVRIPVPTFTATLVLLKSLALQGVSVALWVVTPLAGLSPSEGVYWAPAMCQVFSEVPRAMISYKILQILEVYALHSAELGKEYFRSCNIWKM